MLLSRLVRGRILGIGLAYYDWIQLVKGVLGLCFVMFIQFLIICFDRRNHIASEDLKFRELTSCMFEQWYKCLQGSSFLPRRFLNQESHSHAFLNSDSTFMTSSRAEPTRFRGHLRRSYPDEMMMLHNGFVMGRITDSRDNFHELRLDVDSMSYEQLLELGDRIGYVNTGLKVSEIHSCLGKIKPSISHTLADRKCSICQDEYEGEDEVGKLNCGHSFHVHCVKQWLSRKNACPVCKKTAYVKS